MLQNVGIVREKQLSAGAFRRRNARTLGNSLLNEPLRRLAQPVLGLSSFRPRSPDRFD